MMKVNKSLISGLFLVTTITLSACLVGCTTFGVSNGEWSQLSPSQKKIAMKNYYKQQKTNQKSQAEVDKINAENTPINRLIDGLIGKIPSKTRSSGSSHSHTTTNCSGGSCTSNTNSSGDSTSVTTPF